MDALWAAGLGEVLWDVLPQGRKLGGAPANYAYFINALGGRGVVVSRVGQDALGDEALEQLRRFGLDTSCISRDPDHPTGTVLAELNATGHATYTFPDHVAWDFLELSPETMRLARSMRAVCFGSLAQRGACSRRAIHDYLDATPDDCLKVFDINLRGDFFGPGRIGDSLKIADVLKVSDEELPVLANLFSLAGTDVEQMAALRDTFGLHAVALTCGAQGSVLLLGESLSRQKGRVVRVADTIGAGDSYTASMTLGILAGWDADRVNARATEVSAFVCTRSGAMPDLPQELRIF